MLLGIPFPTLASRFRYVFFVLKPQQMLHQQLFPSVLSYSLSSFLPNLSNNFFYIPALISFSLNAHIVFSSGTLSDRFSPRNFMNVSLSFIWNSVSSSLRLYSLCSMSILNIITKNLYATLCDMNVYFINFNPYSRKPIRKTYN